MAIETLDAPTDAARVHGLSQALYELTWHDALGETPTPTAALIMTLRKDTETLLGKVEALDRKVRSVEATADQHPGWLSEWKHLREQVNTSDNAEANGFRVSTYTEIEHRLSQTPAKTLRGLLAQAEFMASDDAGLTDGNELAANLAASMMEGLRDLIEKGGT